MSCIADLPAGKLEPQRSLALVVHTGDDFDIVLEQIKQARHRYPEERIAIVADHYRLDEMVSAFRAGANGYFVDVITCEVFVKSIELVLMGEKVFPPAFTSHVLDSERDDISREDLAGEGIGKENAGNRHEGKSSSAGKEEAPDDLAIVFVPEDLPVQPLSPREQSILRCLIEGDSNKSIARKIDIAEATVKVHVKAILRKIRVQNRTQAAIWGLSNGAIVRPATNSCLPSTADINERLPNAIDAPSISSKPLELKHHEANHVKIPRIGSLAGKRISRRTTN